MKNILLYLLILAMGGCAGTEAVTSWKKEGAIPRKYKRILVLAITPGDRQLEKQMELQFVRQLGTAGYDALAFFIEPGLEMPDTLNEKQYLNIIKGRNVEAVISIVLTGTEEENRYIQGMTYDHDDFWLYYLYGYKRPQDIPGHYVNFTNYQWRTSLYEMDSCNLIYSINSNIVLLKADVADAETIGKMYAKRTVKDMVKQKILPLK